MDISLKARYYKRPQNKKKGLDSRTLDHPGNNMNFLINIILVY